MTGTGFWWILLASGLYGLVHSFLASNGFKRRVCERLGQSIYRRFYRLFFSIMAGVMLLPILLLAALLPDREIYTIPAPWVYLTLAIQAAAAAGVIFAVMHTGAMRFLGVYQLFARQDPQPEKLVVGGLYRRVRHPIYTFSLVFLWLTPLMSWNILALNLAFSAYMLIGSVFEEDKLVEQFGKAYEDYRRQTPRIIPRLKPKDK